MIQVTRLNGTPVIINADLIKFIETTPDTLVSLTTGEKIMVKEPAEVVAQLATRYRHSVEVRFDEPSRRAPEPD